MIMTVEQQIDQAVEDIKSILCQSAKSRQEAQRISGYIGLNWLSAKIS